MMDIQEVVSILKNDGPTLRLRQCVVVSVQATTATITIAGSAAEVSGVKFMSTYRPFAGDTCWIMTDGRDLFIFGALGADAMHKVGATGEPAFQYSWVNYDTDNVAAFTRDAMGFVYVRGLVKSGTVGSGTPIFTLPVGYRPATQRAFPVSSAGAFGIIVVKADGSVAVSVGSNVNCYLDGIIFSTF